MWSLIVGMGNMREHVRSQVTTYACGFRHNFCVMEHRNHSYLCVLEDVLRVKESGMGHGEAEAMTFIGPQS